MVAGHHNPCHCCSANSAVVVQSGHHHHHHHHHAQQQMMSHQHQQKILMVQPAPIQENTKNLSPLKSKLKILKKLKKKMGLAPKLSNVDLSNLPPLTFHQVHGGNIQLCEGNTIAKRFRNFDKGITFSARPVRVGEKVCIKFLEIKNNWNGAIRFGFTSNDPNNVRNGLPRYACPDLTHKPGYWAKALIEHLADHDAVLFYYVTSAGAVRFGINGEEKGVFFTGVETRKPLWALIDVYGKSTAIELVDPNRQHFNNIRREAERIIEDNAQHSRNSAMDNASNVDRDVERVIVPSMQSVSIHQEPDVELPGLRFQPPGILFSPLQFHTTRGRNIRFSNQQCVATRNDSEFSQGYAFTNRPVILGERLVVQVLATEPMFVGALAVGLTSCDPSRLTSADLPDDSDMLLDRPEYWVLSKDVASSPQPGDEIAFSITYAGEVLMSKNGGPSNVVMHVDHSLKLWAFVDVYGTTQRVRMLASRPSCSSPRQRHNPAPVVAPAPVPVATAAAELSRFSDVLQIQPSVNGGTVLVVNLPPQNSESAPAPVPATPSIYGSRPLPPLPETVRYQNVDTISPPTHLQQWSEALEPTPGQPSECLVCYENGIDSVLYMCGHMCMCYKCAVQQREQGGGRCPLCRAQIRDVIRIYKA